MSSASVDREHLRVSQSRLCSLAQPFLAANELFSNPQANRQPLQQFCSSVIKPCGMELKVHVQTIQDDLQTTKAICIKSEKILDIFPFPSEMLPSTIVVYEKKQILIQISSQLYPFSCRHCL